MATLTTKLYEVITDYQGDSIPYYIGVVEGGWDDRIIDPTPTTECFTLWIRMSLTSSQWART